MDKPSVLLADDNEGTSTLIRALLRPHFQVDVVSDGLEAIEKLKARQYAAIVLDLLMPGTDGYAVLEFLRAESQDLLGRVLVITASISRREMERVRSYPVAGVIRKPFDIEVLLDAVRAITGDCEPPPSLRGPLLASGVLLLLADFLRQRWL